ncbi:hypothetical protein X975_09591, partial [Stegodyphus mimosarum]
MNSEEICFRGVCRRNSSACYKLSTSGPLLLVDWSNGHYGDLQCKFNCVSSFSRNKMDCKISWRFSQT